MAGGESVAAASARPAAEWPRHGLRSPLGVALFAVVAALVLRLPTLAMLPPWGDEALTLNSLTLSMRDLMVERMHQMHSPTYFWLLKLLGLGGESLFLLRLPSALGDSLGAGLTALVAYRLGGWRAGIALGLFYAAMPVMLEEAQDARPNALFFGFLALLLWSAGRLVDHARLAAGAWRRGPPHRAARRLRGTWVALVLAAIGLVNMLPLGIFAIAAVDLAVLWRTPRLRRAWLIQRLVTLVLLAPLIYGFLRYVGRYAGHYWYSSSLRRLLNTLEISAGAGVEFDPDRFLGPGGNAVLLIAFLGLVLLGLFWARRRASFAIVLALAIGTQVLLVLVSLHTSLYVVRYFAIATPALTLLAAVGVAGLIRRHRRLGLAAGTLTLGLLLLQSFDAMYQYGKPRFDLAVQRLRDAGVERLVVHVQNRHLPRSVLYFLQESPEGLRLSPWAAYLAVRNGALLWVVDHPYRRIDALWQALARHGVLAVCDPGVAGLSLLAVAREPGGLAASCPTATFPDDTT